MNWVNSITDYASDALDYLSENEWAANAMAGAAGAGLNYLAQKDQQDFQRRETDRAWDRKMELAKAPNINQNQYDWSDLASGSLTDGGLISQASR